MTKLKDSVAMVTGAASGIGRATATLLAKKGCHLALADLNSEALEQVAADLKSTGVTVTTHTANVAKISEMERLAGEVLAAHGKVNIIINNAGVLAVGKFEDTPLKDYRLMMDVNVWGVIHGCKAFLPALKEADPAHIVNVSSLAGIVPMPMLSAYCASKFAVRGFSDCIRTELKEHGIRVTTIHPGAVNTGIAASAVVSDKRMAGKEPPKGTMDKYVRGPEHAAKKIVAGIERNKDRVLIGAETYPMDFLKRTFPTGFDKVLSVINSQIENRTSN
ncbi:MAG: SDR family NAD(P)-dependent oxidoreductase [Polyangiaceae bacterium]|nr:SDR family NAD(P)-dependent oxidoreductase [Polyangiaceae bacterium]